MTAKVRVRICNRCGIHRLTKQTVTTYICNDCKSVLTPGEWVHWA